MWGFGLTIKSIFYPRKILHWPTSPLEYLGNSIYTSSPLGIPAWSKAFVKSILWFWKHRIHYKINIKATVDHLTSVEYTYKGLRENIFWTSPLTQYHALSLLKYNHGPSFTWDYLSLEEYCDQQHRSMEYSSKKIWCDQQQISLEPPFMCPFL